MSHIELQKPSTRRLLRRWNMPRMRWRLGLRPGPRWGSSRRSPRPRSRPGRGVPLPSQVGDLGERRELPQRGPGRSPSRQRILGIFKRLRSLIVEGFWSSEAWNMPSRNKNFIILPKSLSGHGRTDRTGSAGPEITISLQVLPGLSFFFAVIGYISYNVHV